MHRNIVTDSLSRVNGFFRPRITCVWGDAWKRNLTERGFYPSQSIKVTGNWRYDHILKAIDELDGQTIKERLGIPHDKKIIMFVSGNQNVSEFLNICLKIAEPLDNVFSVIKMHPLDRLTPFKSETGVNHCSRSVFLEELFEGLKIADVVVSQLSTVIGEALLLSKRVIVANFDNLQGWDVYTQSDALFHARTPDELMQRLEECIAYETLPIHMTTARDAFIKNYYFRMDQKSSNRVATIVSNVCFDS